MAWCQAPVRARSPGPVPGWTSCYLSTGAAAGWVLRCSRRSGRRSAPGGCGRASRCPPPAPWPATWARPVERSWRSTSSWPPRDGWWPGMATAPRWRTCPPCRRRRRSRQRSGHRAMTCGPGTPTRLASPGRPGPRRSGAGRGPGRGVRLRRPAGPGRAARGAGRLPRPRPRGARHSGERASLHWRRAWAGRRVPGSGRPRRPHPRCGGSQLATDARDRRRGRARRGGASL